MSTIDPARIAAHVRDVTGDEVAFYRENGWVKLHALTTPGFAAELLAAGLEWCAQQGKQASGWHGLALDAAVEPFRSLVFSEVMGRNAQRLFDRKRLAGVDVPVRYRIDHFISKPPGSGGAAYHQDTTEHGTDRGGEVQFWLALAEATADMGTMRFFSGVHREGPLGAVLRADEPDLVQRYPRMAEHYPMTEPIEYHPGDATVHHGFMVHGSGPNQTDRDRMSYIVSYTPADSRWWNGSVANWGSQRLPLGDARNPIVYPRTEPSDGVS